MNWITDTIAIGNYLDAQDKDMLTREGIRSVLSLDGSLIGRSPADVGVKRVMALKFQDGPGNDPALFLRAVDAVQRLVIETPPVLVHCHAGRSRSVVLVAGYFIKTRGLTPDEAVKLVAAKREAQITPGLESLLWCL